MAAGRGLWIVGIALLMFDDSQTLQNVTAKAGRSCVLWSRGSSNKQVMVLRCCRQETYTPYVFFYRDERVETHGQDPSFSKRVKLVNADISTGGLSLVITDVTFEDSGTYKCLVQTSDEMMEDSRISLMVNPDEGERGHMEGPPTNPIETVRERDGLVLVCGVGVLAVAVAVAVGVSVRFYKRHTSAKTNQREKSVRPSAEELLPSSELA